MSLGSERRRARGIGLARIVAGRAALALLLAATVGACTPASRPAPAAPAAIPGGAPPTAAALRASLEQRDRDLATFRGQARLEYEGTENSFKSSQMIVVEAPSSIRIDVMHPFGISYTIATDGKRLEAFDRHEQVYYEGVARPSNFQRFVGVPLDAADLASLIRGMPPALDAEGDGSVTPVPGGWSWQRPLAGGGSISVLVEPRTLRPTAVDVSGSQVAGSVHGAFSDFQDLGGVSFPDRIELSFSDGSRLTLTYDQVWRQFAVGSTAFAIERPAKARLVDMDAAPGRAQHAEGVRGG